ncbi:hypothetical protein [Roseivivax isoporae]|uniref:Uncharacterized protein n=1 Tax=Roseivivax isoporae LMG 25204 TaxID=1449351 RepID=X7F2Y8_9RHOB|nr:hypothetical protein [Roseivivax isoporae]ETX27287.1 hypothetical protein RISW2_14905 [Roseivivax isoporae LMG 25204]
MSTDVFIAGLAALSFIALLIYVVTAVPRERNLRDDRERQSSSLARGGRSQ